ncbi:MAG TPA: stress response translation initiation inhibitor YciH [Thermoplasmatales archaeon]|nr:MAG: stress response translation initiation inhibitor YciH [Thermoplasmata archaeon]RLF32193.1 MAG: stress response translation initiation inhibitor YciH [Thermoplasmata archaeon]HDN50792.1 stress response translation initiation inhibitor YciH [Thermoplasmatales archaeon]
MSDICKVCGLPKELCVCEKIAREGKEIKITTEKRRYGKMVTVISGLDSSVDVAELTTELKRCCACGGTTKNNVIELQGDHKEKARKKLEELGFTVEIP